MDIRTLLVPATLFVVAIAAATFMNWKQKKNMFYDDKLLERGLNTPTIWIYVDDTDVNSRWWSDFGARSSRVLNLPFLNLCYQTIVEQNKGLYRVEVISGLSDLALRLGGWDKLPTRLQNPNVASIREGELNWIRAAVLANFGGLGFIPLVFVSKDLDIYPKIK